MRSSCFPIHHLTNSWLIYPLLNTDLCLLLTHTIKPDQDTLQELHPVTHRYDQTFKYFFLNRNIFKCEFWGSQTGFQIYLSAFIEYSKVTSPKENCSQHLKEVLFQRVLCKQLGFWKASRQSSMFVLIASSCFFRLGQGISQSLLLCWEYYSFNVFAFFFYLKDTAKKVVVNQNSYLLPAILKNNKELLLFTYILCIRN